MKKLIIRKIILRNWRSINAEVEFSADSTTIFGRNGSGKSSFRFAWSWLLTGYTDALHTKNENLYDNRKEITNDTPESSVKAFIEIDGTPFSLERTAKPKFSRKRGSEEYVKDASDTYKLYIDDVETKQSTFDDWITANICPIDMLLYAIDGNFFYTLAQSKADKARNILGNVAGAINEYDYVKDYSELRAEMNKGFSAEQVIEKAKKQIAEAKNAIESKQNTKANYDKLIAEYSAVDYDALSREINFINAKITSYDEQLQGLADIDKPIMDKRSVIFASIDAVKQERNEAERRYNQTIKRDKQKIYDELCELKNKRNEAEKIRQNIECESQQMKSAKDMIDILQKDLNDAKGLEFDDCNCMYCGQPLPPALLDEHKAKFNANKNKRIEEIKEKAQSYIRIAENAKGKIELLNKSFEDISSGELDEIIREKQAELDNYDKKVIPFSETQQYRVFSAKIDDMTKTLPELPKHDNSAVCDAKKECMDKLKELYIQYAKLEQKERFEREVSSIISTIRDLTQSIADNERLLILAKEFIEERANIISHRINSKLDSALVNIKMWKVLKNGSYAPACTITDEQGVLMSTINHSKKLLMLAELQKLFCNAYDISMPIWIDESDCFDTFTKPKYSDRQTIYIHASDDLGINVKFS